MKKYEKLSRNAPIALLTASEKGKSSEQMPPSPFECQFGDWMQYEVSPELGRGHGECCSHADFYDFAPIGFVIFDARGVIREINLAGSAMLGRERSLLLNTPLISHIIKSDRKKFLCHLARCKQSEGRVVSTISVSMERGNFFHLQLQSIAGRDLLQEIPFYLTALIDVSELAELRSLAEGLTQNEEKVRKSIAAELKEQILGCLGMAQAEIGAKQMNSAAIGETLGLAIRRIESLARRIWPAATEGMTLECALSTLVKTVREEQNVPVEFQSDMLPMLIDEASSATILQVVRELLENAVRYAEAKRIVVSLTLKKGDIVIRIEDSGIGFDPDRVIGSTEKAAGAGIRNSRRRIENIGGAMQIDSAPHSGTSITILVPLKERRRESGYRGNVRQSATLPKEIELPV